MEHPFAEGVRISMYTASLFEDVDDRAAAGRSLRKPPELSGLGYRMDFLSLAEERALMDAADSEPWSSQWKRRTQYYGDRYGASDPNRGGRREIPGWARPVIERLVDAEVFPRWPNQMGVNEYLPGQGIAAHVDHESGTVAIVSMGSGCVMDFQEKATARKESLWLAPRSLATLSGAARHDWTHAIAARRRDLCDGDSIPRARRISLTFRLIL